MANPLDRAGLYKRYKDAQLGRGIEQLFQEEGIGRGPLDYSGDSLADLIKEERDAFNNNRFRLIFPGSKETLNENIKDLREDAEYTVQKELSPKGLGAALQQMRENQKSGLTPIIRDEDGTIIGGGNPLFKVQKLIYLVW